MKRKHAILLLIALCFALSVSAKNAYWKPNIKMTPVSPIAGQKILFTAVLNLEGEGQSGQMQNLRFVAKVDEETIYDETLYYFLPATDYFIKANWTAKSGTHKIAFTVEATDNMTPDSNPNDNRVEKTFTVYERPQINTGNPQGTPTLPGTPNNLQTNNKPNLNFKPCIQYQNEPTDLVVHSLQVSPGKPGKWDYTATVQNLGRRCVKAVEYELNNMNLKLVAYYAGNPSDPVNFFLPEGQTRTIRGQFDEPSGFVFYPSGGNKSVEFEFVIDPNQKIPDPNRDNNKFKITMMIN
jgi:hypothetical protein